jgi:hypothetical protein
VDLCSGANEMKGKTVLLQYEPHITAAKIVGGITAAFTTIGAVIAAIRSKNIMDEAGEGNVKPVADELKASVALPTMLAGAAVTAAGLVGYFGNKIKSDSTTKSPPFAPFPYVKIDSDKIRLQAGMAYIEINKNGNIRIFGKKLELNGYDVVISGAKTAKIKSTEITADAKVKAVFAGATTEIGKGAPTLKNMTGTLKLKG